MKNLIKGWIRYKILVPKITGLSDQLFERRRPVSNWECKGTISQFDNASWDRQPMGSIQKEYFAHLRHFFRLARQVIKI